MKFVKLNSQKKSKNHSTFVLPGWAVDWRIFRCMHAPFDLLCPDTFVPGNYIESVIRHTLRKNSRTVTLIGWSLGAMAALEIATKIPGQIAQLILTGVRCQYGRGELTSVRNAIQNDRKKHLRKFYRQCFLPAQKEDYSVFRSGLMLSYLDEIKRRKLMSGLDYLETWEAAEHTQPGCPVSIIHGTEDVIAPLSEAKKLADFIPVARLIEIPGAGHAAFMRPEFTLTISENFLSGVDG